MPYVYDHITDHLLPMFKFAQRLCHNRDQARDLVQSAALRALEKEHQFCSGTNFLSWLNSIIYTIFIDQTRSKERERIRDLDPTLKYNVLRPNSLPDELLYVDEIRREIKKMPLHHQQVLTMITLDELNYDSTADALSLPVGTIRSRLNRARINLAKCVERNVL